MPEFIIFGALNIELRGLLGLVNIKEKHRLGPTRIYVCEYRQKQFIVVRTGMGQDNVKAALKNLENIFGDRLPEKVLVAGIGGAAARDLKAGQVVCFKDICLITGSPGSLSGSNRFSLDTVASGGYRKVHGATVEFLATDKCLKDSIYRQFGAEAVDMESYFIAQKYINHKSRVMVVRAISDTASQTLPPFFKHFSQQSTAAGLFHFVCCMVKPSCLKQAVTMYKNTKSAIANLGLAVKKLVLD